MLVTWGWPAAAENRSFDGSNNHLAHPDWGAAGTPLLRFLPADYIDGIGMPRHTNRPSPRGISNRVCAQPRLILNQRELSRYVFQWGQFMDHDMTLVLFSDPAESYPIAVPPGDPWFDPVTSGVAVLPFARSAVAAGTGTSTNNPRQHANTLTAYLDASQVYGSDSNRAAELRSFAAGKLKTSAFNLLPFNTNLIENFNEGPFPDEGLYLAGDVRVNEQAGLTALHTLFMREHNRQCDLIATEHPTWDDEQVFQRARKRVSGLLQVITYREFLPVLLGPHAPHPEARYDTNINAGIATEFATALYRVGHTMVSPFHLRILNDNMPAPEGPLALKDAFFNPTIITNEATLEALLKGLAAGRQEQIDRHVVDDLRNFLFGPPGAGGLDLPALNLQRGRDHGLPDYNTIRAAFGLAPALSFSDITSDTDLAATLAGLYGTVTNVELWVGAICEDLLPDAPVGELLAVGISNQFTRLRDGDRFWYANDPDLSPAEIAELEASRLSDVIRHNTGITTIQDHVFMVIPEPTVNLALSETPSGNPVVRWMALSNATYQVQACDDLSGLAWDDIGGLVQGADQIEAVVDTDSSTRARSYRIRQYP